MDKTWVVICPKSDNGNHINQRQGWSLLRNELESIGSDYSSPKMVCTVCGNKFSLNQGVREAFTSDLAIDYFLHNASEQGAIEVEVGKVSRISFAEPFEGSPAINLTPYFNVHVASAQVSASAFTLLSCSSSVKESKGRIDWSASGNRAYGAVPIWRGLLSNAKEHQLRKNFRSEIVELESAIEAFIGEYLGKNLKTKLRQETIDWLLRLSVEQQTEMGFIELIGRPLREICSTEYHKWKESVKRARNDIVHRGAQATSEQAKEARKATFDLLTKTDSSAIEHFQIQVESIRIDRPNIIFGTARIKAGETQATVKFA
jgi:hypothetical protein